VRAGGTGSQDNHDPVDLERIAGLEKKNLGSGPGLGAPGSCVVHRGQVVPGATQLDPCKGWAVEQGRVNTSWGTGSHAGAGSGSTTLAQPAGPGSPSAGCGCVSPRTRAAGGEAGGWREDVSHSRAQHKPCPLL
jgi:hypothetical protein